MSMYIMFINNYTFHNYFLHLMSNHSAVDECSSRMYSIRVNRIEHIIIKVNMIFIDCDWFSLIIWAIKLLRISNINVLWIKHFTCLYWITISSSILLCKHPHSMNFQPIPVSVAWYVFAEGFEILYLARRWNVCSQ